MGRRPKGMMKKIERQEKMEDRPQLPQYSQKLTRACRRPIRLLTAVSVQRRSDRMYATANPGVSVQSMVIKPPSHPTYDLNGVIKLALAEDAGDLGDVTTLATVPSDVEVEAHFLAKEDGVIAGIALAEMVFQEVDPSLKVEWSQKDGDYVHKGLKIGRVYGTAYSIVVAERVALNFMQRMSGIATLTKAFVMVGRLLPAFDAVDNMEFEEKLEDKLEDVD
uniref:nicotinate-nucleotide diphosphorylase (carboxylating) n=1 Tax=Cannabis sativa TaxID=3483 RepID=A0A803PBJ9_CANSA